MTARELGRVAAHLYKQAASATYQVGNKTKTPADRTPQQPWLQGFVPPKIKDPIGSEFADVGGYGRQALRPTQGY